MVKGVKCGRKVENGKTIHHAAYTLERDSADDMIILAEWCLVVIINGRPQQQSMGNLLQLNYLWLTLTSSCRITSLEHEVCDNSVKLETIEVSAAG
jgi:hypothetical protein